MKTLFKKHRVILSVLFLLTPLFWLGMDSEVFARAGGGKSSGSLGSKSYSRPAPSQTPAAPQQQGQMQPPSPPAGTGRSFLSGMAGGIMGGLLGGMLFRSLGFAGSGMGGGGFGFGDLLLILVILGIIYFVVKRFRSRNTMQMSAVGAGSSSYPAPALDPVYALPALEQSPRIRRSKGFATSGKWTHPSARKPSRIFQKISSSRFKERGQNGISAVSVTFLLRRCSRFFNRT